MHGPISIPARDGYDDDGGHCCCEVAGGDHRRKDGSECDDSEEDDGSKLDGLAEEEEVGETLLLPDLVDRRRVKVGRVPAALLVADCGGR
mmetsp:Transcript_10836/g.26767  ORF Transcript_10836/g.26767 Transcript_10836/m.26767 type:complete len:90 (+) Transcript_10836:1442-1711(+)